MPETLGNLLSIAALLVLGAWLYWVAKWRGWIEDSPTYRRYLRVRDKADDLLDLGRGDYFAAAREVGRAHDQLRWLDGCYEHPPAGLWIAATTAVGWLAYHIV